MQLAKPMLAVAASTALLGLSSSAHADELALPSPPSEAPPIQPTMAAAPTNASPEVVAAQPTLAPMRPSLWAPPPAPIADPRPNNPTLGAWGIVSAVLGASAMTAGLGLIAAEEYGGGVPTLLVGTTATVAGLVMTGVGYSSRSTQQEPSVQVERAARVTPNVPEPSWEEQQAKRQARREVGMGLTITGVLTGAGAVALFAASAAEGGCGMFDGGGGYCVGGGATVLVTGALLGVGIPLWAANSRDLPRPPVHAELGIGPGSIELRGSF